MASRKPEVHHAAPRCLVSLHERANGLPLDGEGIQAWLGWEWEATRWRAPVEIFRAELEVLVERSAVVLEPERHRLVHGEDCRRWGARGGRETLRRYGADWFALLASSVGAGSRPPTWMRRGRCGEAARAQCGSRSGSLTEPLKDGLQRAGGAMTGPLPLGAPPRAGRRHARGLKNHPRGGGDPFAYVARHAAGDWGELCASDHRQNGIALRDGYRVFSFYAVGEGHVFWVITEADRFVTTILLPEEY